MHQRNFMLIYLSHTLLFSLKYYNRIKVLLASASEADAKQRTSKRKKLCRSYKNQHFQIPIWSGLLSSTLSWASREIAQALPVLLTLNKLHFFCKEWLQQKHFRTGYRFVWTSLKSNLPCDHSCKDEVLWQLTFGNPVWIVTNSVIECCHKWHIHKTNDHFL